jgi:hypothetical protein
MRTLCVGFKLLSDGEYEEWNRDYNIASNAVVDRVKL